MMLGVDVHITELPLPIPWTAEHDDGSQTYSRAQVLDLIATARHQSANDPGAREWALVMLDTYDA